MKLAVAMIFILLFIVNIICIYQKKRSKILTLLLFVSMWVLHFGSRFSDISFYLSDYETVRDFQGGLANIFSEFYYEPGFLLLMFIFSKLGFSFTFFFATVTLVCYILIYLTAKKFTKNFALIIIMYLLSFFFISVVIFRNFIAVSIFVFVFPILKKKTLESKLIFLVGIFLASMFHLAALLFLPFVFLPIKNYNAIKTIVICCIVLSFLIVLLNIFMPGSDLIANFVLSITGSTRIWYYLRSGTRLGFIPLFVLVVLIFYLSKSLIDRGSKKKSPVLCRQNSSMKLLMQENGHEQFLYQAAIFAAYYAFVFLPLIALQTNFYRQIINLLPILFILIAHKTDGASKKENIKIVNVALISSFIAGMIVIGVLFKFLLIFEVFINNIF